MSNTIGFPDRLHVNVDTLELNKSGGPIIVAVSGGLDSCVLLHLLRFYDYLPGLQLLVAHFDHRMRERSRADADWVAGLCRAWGLPLIVRQAVAPLVSEEAARHARYDFLESVRAETGATAILTGHHADDQAETVLFRVFRGTGHRGLAGIPASRDGTIVRPLLDFWRDEIEAYARRVGMTWLSDETNQDLRFARNTLRTRILPDVERLIAPSARKALVRLAKLARNEEEGWQSLLPELIEPLSVFEEEGRLSFDRKGLAEFHPAIQARILRSLAGRVGLRLGERVTRLALDFAVAGSSGKWIDLGASMRLSIDLDRLVIGREQELGEHRSLSIPGTWAGGGEVVLDGSSLRVEWGCKGALAHPLSESFESTLLRFPLLVRSRKPGDRIHLAYGTVKVKKLLLDQRVRGTERQRVPVIVDATGDVLWIPGVAKAKKQGYADCGSFTIGVG